MSDVTRRDTAKVPLNSAGLLDMVYFKAVKETTDFSRFTRQIQSISETIKSMFYYISAGQVTVIAESCSLRKI